MDWWAVFFGSRYPRGVSVNTHRPNLWIGSSQLWSATFPACSCYLEYKDGPSVAEYESQQDFIIRKLKSQPEDAIKGNPKEVAMKCE